MHTNEDIINKKIQQLLQDNTQLSIDLNQVMEELAEKDFRIRTLINQLNDEREINTVTRDCVLRFSNETSLPGLISVCAEYILHYYSPDIVTFYIDSNELLMTENNKYSHVFDFKENKNLLTTRPDKLKHIFEQMVKSQQVIKNFSSLDLTNLEEQRTLQAMLCKVQYSNKIIGFVLLEFMDTDKIRDSKLISLILELFANNYSILTITNILAQRYDYVKTQATIDFKTGIFNSRQFLEDVKELGDRPYCLLSMDIDDFKQVNDNYGHDSGDKTLEFVGRKIHEKMRELGGNGYREGGDEFLGISLASLEETIEAVKELLHEISIHLFEDANGLKYSITNSAGLYRKQEGESVDIVKKKADILLYESKQKGKKHLTVNQNVSIES